MTSTETTQGDPARHSPRFDAYVDIARHGRNGIGRIAVSIVLIAACWIAGTFAILLLSQFHVYANLDDPFALSPDDALERFFASAPGLAALLASVATIWIGVWLAVRLVHRRPVSGLLGIGRRLLPGDFARALVAALVAGIVSIVMFLAVDDSPVRTDVSLGAWLLALTPFLLLILAQSSAEEALFRGYLHQSLAARFHSPLVWAALPTAAFVLLHWYDNALETMNAAVLVNIAAFSVVMTLLVWKTGNLSACFGAHFGTNVCAMLLFSAEPDTASVSLFQGRMVTDTDWTATEAVLLGFNGVFSALLLAALLLHRASPLRLDVVGRSP